MTEPDRLTARGAVESLRSGVPSGAVVRALGWSDPTRIQPFERLLSSCEHGVHEPLGLLVKGDFGTGKSHLLGCLEQIALQRNFVVSRVVISKETPLFKPDKVLAAAVWDGRVPGSRGSVLHELAPRIDFRSPAADALSSWAAGAPGMLAATIHLLEHNVELVDDELIARIIDWWSGEKLSMAEVTAGLRKIGAREAFDVRRIKASDLVAWRIALTSHVIRAAGYSGWVILLDEIELIGRYSRLQRANSYAQLARWFGLDGDGGTSIVLVGTITDDFVPLILDGNGDGRDDRERLPEWLSNRRMIGGSELAAAASRGMEIIDGTAALHLQSPDESVLRHTYEQVRLVYSAAFGWEPRVGAPRVIATTTPMRTYIKTWIYEWDLVRLGVTEQPSIETETLSQSYDEDATLEKVDKDFEGE